MTKLEIAKKVIYEHYDSARLGIFDCRNDVGDEMINIYDKDGLSIDICYYHEYFEVFGLSQAEFEELEIYYNSIYSKPNESESNCVQEGNSGDYQNEMYSQKYL